MENTSFMRVDEVAEELGVSKSYAYKIVQRLNAELKEKGIKECLEHGCIDSKREIPLSQAVV